MPKCDLDDRSLWPFYEKVQALDMTLIPQTSGLWGGMSIEKLPWKPDVLPKILYKNALRYFKLEDDPKFKEMYP